VIKVAQIAPFRRASDDYDETERLKSQFACLRQQRQPFYLTASEFEEILKWKLRGQLGRQRKVRAANTDEIIRAVTGLALTITHSDKEYELELRVRLLCALRGVAVPVASAVLALVFPEDYAVIDFRGWRQVFAESRTTFSIPDYKKYTQEVRRLSKELGWPVQEVDLAIWEYDKRHSK
jgi:thermostable 8-oxoguanine DNA glycosylase